MRVRVALRALWALWDKRVLLNPVQFPLFSWQLASHKLLRYVSFLPLTAAAAMNWLLLSHGWKLDRKSTRLNSSHRCISYAVFCLKKKRRATADAVGLTTRNA